MFGYQRMEPIDQVLNGPKIGLFRHRQSGVQTSGRKGIFVQVYLIFNSLSIAVIAPLFNTIGLRASSPSSPCQDALAGIIPFVAVLVCSRGAGMLELWWLLLAIYEVAVVATWQVKSGLMPACRQKRLLSDNRWEERLIGRLSNQRIFRLLIRWVSTGFSWQQGGGWK